MISNVERELLEHVVTFRAGLSFPGDLKPSPRLFLEGHIAYRRIAYIMYKVRKDEYIC